MASPKKRSVIFIGRFQPLHRGHVSVILDLIDQFDEVIIAIGSMDKYRTPENPFTVGERHAMVTAVMDELKVPRMGTYRVVPMNDIDDNEKWPKHVIDTCGKFDIVCTGNDLVSELFTKKARKEVMPPKKKYAITATQVREAITRGEDLEKYLHTAVIAFLQKIGAARKMVEIAAETAGEKLAETSKKK